MTTISTIPQWLQQGEIFQFLSKNNDDGGDDGGDDGERGLEAEPFVFPKTLKLDLHFESIADVIQCIDTCLYVGLHKLPRELYDFCLHYPLALNEMWNLPDDCYFKQTEEYKACGMCAIVGKEYLLDHAISQNNMACIRYCVEDLQVDVTIGHFRLAIYENQISICKYIIQQYPGWISSLKMCCGFYYDLAQRMPCCIEMVSYLYEEIGVCWPYNILASALGYKNLVFSIYAIQHGCEIRDHAVDLALPLCSIELMQLLAERNVPLNNVFLLNYAIQFATIDMVKFLYDHGARPNSNSLILAENDTEKIEFIQQIMNE